MAIDEKQYIAEVLAVCNKQGRTPDYFERYYLDLDEEDEAKLRDHFKLIGPIWSKLRQYPLYGPMINRMIEEKAKVEKSLLDPTTRASYREMLRQARKEALENSLQEVRDAVAFLCSKGYVSPVQKDQLLQTFKAKGIAEADILAQLPPDIPVVDKFYQFPKPKFDLTLAKNLEKNLGVFDKKDIYDFLGLEETSSAKDIQQKYQKAKEIMQIINTYFIITNRRTEYDEYLQHRSDQGSKVFGIDLGTTNSCIAKIDENGKAIIIPNLEGQPTTPSVVYFEDAENIVVGQTAKNLAVAEPDRVVDWVKRYMGDPTFTREFDGISYRPEEISSFILRKVVEDASARLNEEIKDVIITCPAYFGIAEVEATKAAGDLAGLNVLMVLREPIAAAIAYGLHKEQDKTVLVFDLGGGNFDLTLIKIAGNDIYIILSSGNKYLGGTDWDKLLIEHIAAKFTEANPGMDPLEDPLAVQELAKVAEEIKYGLTNKTSQKKMFQYRTGKLMLEVTREELENLTRPLLESAIQLTRELIEKAGKKGHNRIDQILLVGGSCFMPAVKKAVDDAFSIPSKLFEPNESVAKGAALMGYHIKAREEIFKIVAELRGVSVDEVKKTTITEKEVLLFLEEKKKQGDSTFEKTSAGPLTGDVNTPEPVNVCSKGFGIKVRKLDDTGDEIEFLIEDNTPVPVTISKTYETFAANMENLNICIYEQNDSRVLSRSLDANHEIFSKPLPLPPGLPKGAPIKVVFDLDRNGRLSVKAFDPSGNEIKWDITIKGVMTAEEDILAQLPLDISVVDKSYQLAEPKFDKTLAANLERNLGAFDKKDLYDFLGLDGKASDQEIKRNYQKEKETIERKALTDPIRQPTKEILQIINTYFIVTNRRKEYDEYLQYRKLSKLEEKLKLSAADKRIAPEEYAILEKESIALGFSKDEAKDVILALANKYLASVELPPLRVKE